MDGIQVSVEKIGPQSDISIIRVGGYIDTTTSSELERALDSLLKTGVVRIIIDLGNVDYISSAGWGIFISEIKGMRERNGDLKLARMIPDVYEVFELLEFHYILKAFNSIEEAISDFDMGKGVIPSKKEKEIEIENSIVTEKITENKQKVEEVSESINDKIQKIIEENPFWGASKIVKELNSEKYGFVRMNRFAVWKTLRKLKSESKKQRGAVEQKGESE